MKGLYLVLMGLVFVGGVANASEGYCSAWEKRRGYSCIFAGSSGDIWVRQCFHKDDLQKVCTKTNPNQFVNGCSQWVKAGGVSCSNGVDFVQKWVRACDHKDLRQQICTDDDPNSWGDN